MIMLLAVLIIYVKCRYSWSRRRVPSSSRIWLDQRCSVTFSKEVRFQTEIGLVCFDTTRTTDGVVVVANVVNKSVVNSLDRVLHESSRLFVIDCCSFFVWDFFFFN